MGLLFQWPKAGSRLHHRHRLCSRHSHSGVANSSPCKRAYHSILGHARNTLLDPLHLLDERTLSNQYQELSSMFPLFDHSWNSRVYGLESSFRWLLLWTSTEIYRKENQHSLPGKLLKYSLFLFHSSGYISPLDHHHLGHKQTFTTREAQIEDRTTIDIQPAGECKAPIYFTLQSPQVLVRFGAKLQVIIAGRVIKYCSNLHFRFELGNRILIWE